MPDTISLQTPIITKSKAAYWTSGLLFLLIAIGYFPQFKYHIEGDAMGYIGSVQRYINGDYFNAINGFWSPLSIWLTAIGVKITGGSIVPVAYALNTISMLGIVLLSMRLLQRYVTSYSLFELWVFGIGNAIFWCMQMQIALFADGLNALLLLVTLNILLTKNYEKRWFLWLLTGIVAAIAYMAKSYSFYAVPLLTLAIVWYKLRQQGIFSVKNILPILLVSIGTMLLFSFPWLYVLYHKYQVWTLSNAGTLNNSWFAFGIMYFSEDIKQLVPPPYSNAMSCWDDLWFHHGKMYGLFDSPKIVILRIRRLVINLMNWPALSSSLSPFYFVTWCVSIVALLSKHFKTKHTKIIPLILAFLLFPLGYFTLLISGRYIWFTIPLGMIITIALLHNMLYQHLNALAKKSVFVLFICSWLPSSIMQLLHTRESGKHNYAIAQQLNQLGITNASMFTNDGMNDMNKAFNIAYYTHNQYYMNFNSNWKIEDVMKDAEKFGVKYYFHFYKNADRDFVLKKTNGIPCKELTKNNIEGLKVFDLNP